MVLTRQRLADLVLISAVAGGLFSPLGLMLLLPAVIIRDEWGRSCWRLENTLLLLAAIWGCVVIAVRGTADSAGTLPYFAFLWTLPHIMAVYRPDQMTIRRFESLLMVLFVMDFLFNIGTLVTGSDLLGRTLDAREGIVGGRLGGIFAHSFYSGAISLAALLTLVARKRYALLAILPAANLVMSGSWRFTSALLIAALLAFRWRQRGKVAEAALVITISLAIIAGVAITSGLFSGDLNANPSNTLRILAWLNSIDKIIESPWLGVGYPNENAISEDGASFETMDENLIAESWYLGSAITLGVPYTLLFLGTFLVAFYGSAFNHRNLTQAILYPFILIDLTYGSFFGSVLIYCWLWLHVFATPPLQTDSSGMASHSV